jgi:hypothetical protein
MVPVLAVLPGPSEILVASQAFSDAAVPLRLRIAS